MKIRCDYCNKEEASVFCSADEAALCTACDHQVHHANKLAGKHMRFSLIQPTSKDFPLCDICQERRALLFCKEDRAILCRECDIPIHKSNEHTQKHNRFLLTGVKLSASSSQYPTKSASSNESSTPYHETNTSSLKPQTRKPVSSVSSEISTFASSGRTEKQLPCGVDYTQFSEPNSDSASNIFEYLMKGIPGWKVEDLLDIPQATQSSFVKNRDVLLPSLVHKSNGISSIPSEDLSCWVPQVPISSPQILSHNGMNTFDGFKRSTEVTSGKLSRTWDKDVYAVPEIGSPLVKKSKYYW